jgi:amino acid transporter, AAT family
VPVAGINVSAAAMLIGVALNYLVPEKVFTWVTSIALIGTLWTWIIIMVSHAGYRRAIAAGRAQPVAFRMPGAPAANWLVVAFLLAVAALLWLDPNTRVALYVAPFWFGLLWLAFSWLSRRTAD